MPHLCLNHAADEAFNNNQMRAGIIRFALMYINFVNIFIDWLFLYRKSHNDILQGISKLDNILKVSVI